MSSPLITISAKANVRQALGLMRLNAIKKIPVTDNIHILGIVTQGALPTLEHEYWRKHLDLTGQ